MADKQQQQVNSRQVINTIEDTNKYQTGDARRLRIMADPLRIPVAERQSSANQLAQALSSIKPQLMNYAVDKQAEAYGKEITQGQLKALRHASPEEVKGEMEKHGFDVYGGYLGGEELGDKLENDWKSTPRTVGMEFDAWYKEWWKTNADPSLTGKSSVYLDKFNTAFGKNLIALQTAHATEQQGFQVAAQEDSLSKSVLGAINDVKASGKEFGGADLEAISNDIKSFTQKLQPGRVDELTYQAASSYAKDSKDISVLKPFFEKKADGTPSFADKKYNDNSRWGDKIRADIDNIKTDSYNAQIRDSKTVETERTALRNEAYLKMLTGDFTDENIQEVTRDMAKKGLFSTIGEANAEAGHLISLNKKQETKAQTIRGFEIRSQINEGRGVNPAGIIAAFRAEEISKEGATTALAEYEQKLKSAKAEQRADARAEKTSSTVYKDVTFGRGKEIITNFFKAKDQGLEGSDYVGKEALALKRAEAIHEYSYKAMTAKSPSEMLQFATDISTQYQLTVEEGASVPNPKVDKYFNK